MADGLRGTIGDIDADMSNVTNLRVQMISKMPSPQPVDGPEVYPHDYMPENVADVIVYLRNFYTAAKAGRKNLLVLRTSLTLRDKEAKFIWSHAMLLLAGIDKKTKEFWIQVFDPNGIYQVYYKTNPKSRYEGIEWIPWVFLELSYYTVEIKFTAEVKKFAETARELHGKKDTIKPWTVYFMRVFMENMAVYPNREDVNQIHHVVELWKRDLIEVIDQDRKSGRPNLLDEAGFDTMDDLIKAIRYGHRGGGVCEHIVDLVALMVISMPEKYRNGWESMAYGDYNTPCAPSYGNTNDPSSSSSSSEEEEEEKKESKLICPEVMISEEKEYGWLNGLFLSTEYSDQIGPKAWRAMVALETWGYLDGFTGVISGASSRFDGLSWQLREYQRRTNKRQKKPLGVSKVLELFQPGGGLDPSHPSADMARYFMGVHADQNMDGKSIPDSDYVLKVWWMLTNAINMFRIWMEIGDDSGKLIQQLGLPSDVPSIQLAMKKPVDVMRVALNYGNTKPENIIIVKSLKRNFKQMHSSLVASVQRDGKLSDRDRRFILRLFTKMNRLFPRRPIPHYLVEYSNDIFRMEVYFREKRMKSLKLRVELTLKSINKRVFNWHYVFRSMVKDVVKFLKYKAAITYTQSGLFPDEIGKMATLVDLLFRDPIQESARQRGSLIRQHGTVEMWYLLNECMRRARREIELEARGHLKRIKDFPAIELIVLDRNFPIFLTPPIVAPKGFIDNPLMSAMALTWIDISDKIIHEWGGRPVHVLDCLARWVVSVRAMPKNVFTGGLVTEMILAGNLRKDLRLSKDTRVKLLTLHIHWKESTKTVVNHYEAWGVHRDDENSTYAVIVQGLSEGYYVTKAVINAIKISGLPGSLPEAKTFKNMLKAPLWNLLKGYFVPSLHMMIQLRGLASMHISTSSSQRRQQPAKKRQKKKGFK